MKCPKCVELGLKSTLTVGPSMSTAAYSQPFYDEEGRYHKHSSNTTIKKYKCSNGHKFKIKSKPACPQYPKHCNHEGFETYIIEENLL